MQTIGALEKVKKTLYHSMKFYWKVDQSFSWLPSILDPRIKSLEGFTQPEERRNAKTELRNKYNDFKINYQTITSNISSTATSISSTITATITTSIYPSSSITSHTFNQPTLFSIFNRPLPSPLTNEVDEYLALSEIGINEDPFTWWRSNKTKFPILNQMARTYLSVSATSTPSERLFSDCGNLMTTKRTRLSPEFFKRLIFLKRNYNMITNMCLVSKNNNI